MNKGDTILAVFNPPSGVALFGRQEELIGQELRWEAVMPDPLREGHWLMVPQYQKPKYPGEAGCNIASSAYLNQVEELETAKHEFTQHDVDELDTRIAMIQKKRDDLAAKLNRPEEDKDKQRDYSGLKFKHAERDARLVMNQFDPNFFKRELLIIRNEIDALIRIL